MLDPEICFKVDSALAFCGCASPSQSLRQFIYYYHQSSDFDHETLKLLVRIYNQIGDDEVIWNQITGLEIERDCGLPRDEYLLALTEIIDQLSLETESLVQPLTA